MSTWSNAPSSNNLSVELERVARLEEQAEQERLDLEAKKVEEAAQKAWIEAEEAKEAELAQIKAEVAEAEREEQVRIERDAKEAEEAAQHGAETLSVAQEQPSVPLEYCSHKKCSACHVEGIGPSNHNVWFCCNCRDGPYADWQYICQGLF